MKTFVVFSEISTIARNESTSLLGFSLMHSNDFHSKLMIDNLWSITVYIEILLNLKDIMEKRVLGILVQTVSKNIEHSSFRSISSTDRLMKLRFLMNTYILGNLVTEDISSSEIHEYKYCFLLSDTFIHWVKTTWNRRLVTVVP